VSAEGWEQARKSLAGPRRLGFTVTWAHNRNEVAKCWVQNVDADAPISMAHLNKQETGKDLLFPGVESSKDFYAWLNIQKKWWKELRGRRNRVARQHADVVIHRARGLGMTAAMRAQAKFQVVTWRLEDTDILDHDLLLQDTSKEAQKSAGSDDYDKQHFATDSNSEEEEGASSSSQHAMSEESESEGYRKRYRTRGTRTRRKKLISSSASSASSSSGEGEKEFKASSSSKKSVSKKESKRKWIHNDWCHLCKVGGGLVCCNWCPRSYHPSCIGRDDIPKGYFSCPQHQCAECQRKASDAGGLLFRCVVCPCSYCEDHVPSEHHSGRKDLPNGCEELEQVGYVQPTSAYYIVCSYSCTKYYDAFKRDFEGYKEENRPDGKEHVMIDGEEKLVDKHHCACVAGYEEPEKLHCLCQTPYDEEKFYIGCDDCRKWYHGSCVGVKPGDIPEEETWSCPLCVMKNLRAMKRGDEDLFEISQRALERADMSDDDDYLPDTPPSSDVDANGDSPDAEGVVDMSVGSKFVEETTMAERERLAALKKKKKKKKAAAARKKAQTQNMQTGNLSAVIQTWGVENVCGVLMALNMGEYIPLFQQNNITGLKFLMLDPNAMMKLGMKAFHAMRLYSTVANAIAGSVGSAKANGVTVSAVQQATHATGARNFNSTPAVLDQQSATAAASPHLNQQQPVVYASTVYQPATQVISVDPQLKQWPELNFNSHPTHSGTKRIDDVRVELKNPMMVLVQNGHPTPLYAPSTGSYMFHNVPPGCPLPRLLPVRISTDVIPPCN